jgi:endoglucanase
MGPTLALALLPFWLTSATTVTPSDDLRVNQIGYSPRAAKRVVVAETEATAFEVRDAQGAVRHKGALVDRGFWEDSGERLKVGDFTALAAPGTYTIAVEGKGVSHPFEIKNDLYLDALAAAVKSFYFQRASMALDLKYAGPWARAAGHPDSECRFDPSSGHADGALSSPKGWYDAGDCNKYVVNAGITVATMLLSYERHPELLVDRALDIPESGNGVSDFLDEIRYELDWLLTMQDDDGGAFVKISAKGFPGMIMPADDHAERFVIGKSTSATLDFAAMTAQAARVWRTIDPAFAERCRAAAERAWRWAVAHPEVVFQNPPDVQTGGYSPTRLDDDFYLAAAQLLITTGGDEYLRRVRADLRDVQTVEGASWIDAVRNTGSYLLAALPSPLPETDRQRLRRSIVAVAEQLLERIERSPHRVPLETFAWGSNGTVCDQAVALGEAYELTREPRFLAGVGDVADWIFGRNATGYSFVTGLGAKRPMHIHHRASEADGVAEPVPGLLVGGPNARREDDVARFPWGVKYGSTRPAKSYVDAMGSWASNEVCINWNAPLVYMLGFLEAQRAALDATPGR